MTPETPIPNSPRSNLTVGLWLVGIVVGLVVIAIYLRMTR